MSQRKYRYKNFEVLTGWDRPLQYFFLVVEDLVVSYHHDGYVFTNLNRPNPAMTLYEIEYELNKLNIPLPPGLIDDLKIDRAINAENLEKDYGVVNG